MILLSKLNASHEPYEYQYSHSTLSRCSLRQPDLNQMSHISLFYLLYSISKH
jgi:hypothetical protein